MPGFSYVRIGTKEKPCFFEIAVFTYIVALMGITHNKNMSSHMPACRCFSFSLETMNGGKKFGDADKQKTMLLDACKLANFTRL